MAEKDITEKILESFNDVFADIVNVLLFNGEEVVRDYELEDQAPRSYYKVDGKIREIERDVAKRWKHGGIRIACIGAENQTEADADMPFRVIGYDGAEYRSQLNNGSTGDRYPVITMVLYFGTKKHWDKPTSLLESLEIPEKLLPYVNDYKLNLFEIAYLTHEQVKMFKSDFRIVADYFVQKRENNNYIPDSQKLEHIQEVLQTLRILTGDRRFEDVYPEIEGGAVSMCEVIDRIEQKGVQQGENNVSGLMSILLEQGKVEDAKRAASDPDFRHSLMKKFSITP